METQAQMEIYFENITFILVMSFCELKGFQQFSVIKSTITTLKNHIHNEK